MKRLKAISIRLVSRKWIAKPDRSIFQGVEHDVPQICCFSDVLELRGVNMVIKTGKGSHGLLALLQPTGHSGAFTPTGDPAEREPPASCPTCPEQPPRAGLRPHLPGARLRTREPGNPSQHAPGGLRVDHGARRRLRAAERP